MYSYIKVLCFVYSFTAGRLEEEGLLTGHGHVSLSLSDKHPTDISQAFLNLVCASMWDGLLYSRRGGQDGLGWVVEIWQRMRLCTKPVPGASSVIFRKFSKGSPLTSLTLSHSLTLCDKNGCSNCLYLSTIVFLHLPISLFPQTTVIALCHPLPWPGRRQTLNLFHSSNGRDSSGAAAAASTQTLSSHSTSTTTTTRFARYAPSNIQPINPAARTSKSEKPRLGPIGGRGN